MESTLDNGMEADGFRMAKLAEEEMVDWGRKEVSEAADERRPEGERISVTYRCNERRRRRGESRALDSFESC
jgi:hypothetical protein